MAAPAGPAAGPRAGLNDPGELTPFEAALLETIAEQRAADPLIAPKIAGKEILHRLLKGIQSERGVHIESLLTILGALAGFSCQMAIRRECGLRGSKPPFVEVKGQDGQTFYFGDELNGPLAQERHAIWSLSAGMAHQLGAGLPDVAVQQAIAMAKDVIDPGAAVKIVMESAIPMSKVDPQIALAAPTE